MYPEMSDCVYLIAQPNGTYVNISFISFDIDCNEIYSVPSDFIEIRDGDSEDSPLMERFCGNGTRYPSVMMSTQNYLRIK